MKTLLLALGHVLVLAQVTLAFPQFDDCIASTWFVGATTFGAMGTLGQADSNTCVILGLPATYNPCQEYTLTVQSNSRVLAHKIWAQQGTWQSGGNDQGQCRHTGGTKQTSSSYVWKAPAGELATVPFKAICGGLSGGATVILTTQPVNRNLGAPAFTSGCPAPTSSPTTAAPSQVPSKSPTPPPPTSAPTLPPPLGTNGLPNPDPNNWRNNLVFDDIRVAPGARIQFNWVGTHSVVQYKNQVDFEKCAVANATILAPLSAGGSFLLTVPETPGTVWISCGVVGHCVNNAQKFRIFVELPQMSPKGIIPPPLDNWKVQTYPDLVVQRGQEISFQWNGTHSLVQFANQKDFDECALTKAKIIVGIRAGGSYVFRASKVGNFWLGCSAGNGAHCQAGQRVKIIVTPPEIGPDGLAPQAANWKLNTVYADLTVAKGTTIRFGWSGSHSLLRLADLNRFDTCSTSGATVLVAQTSPSGGAAEIVTKTNQIGDVLPFACGVGTHCSQGQKVKVTIGRVVVGPDAVFPVQKNNWRAKPYSDLRVAKGTDVTLNWDGTHSVVEFANQVDWDACNMTNAVVLSPVRAFGNVTLSFDTAGATRWLGCGVGAHCSSLGQKFRVFVDADVAAAGETPAGPGDATAAPANPPPDAVPAAGSDTGVILGSITGVLVAAAIIVYRQRRSRTLSEGDMAKRTLPMYEDKNERGGDLEAQNLPPNVPEKPRAAAAATLPPIVARTAPSSSFPAAINDSENSASFAGPMATSSSNGGTLNKPRTPAQSVATTVATKFEEIKSSARAQAGTLRAQAGTLKKTFAEKREIAMRSFRPIVALDIPVPPPPPVEEMEAPQSSAERKTFKPHAMYGQVSVKLPEVPVGDAHLRSVAKESPSSSATKPSTSATKPQSSIGSQTASRTPAPGSSATSTASSASRATTRFAPTAAEMSSPDNFQGVASKIKQSVRTRASEIRDKTPSSSAGSLVPQSGMFNAQHQTSSANPMFEAVHEGDESEPADDETEPQDLNGVAKPYGTIRNHPLYGRTLSV